MCFVLLSLFHMKIDNLLWVRTPQSLHLSSDRLETGIRFLVDSGKYIILSICVVCLIPLLSFRTNLIVLVHDAIVLYETPLIPIFGTDRIAVSRLSRLQIW